MKMKMPSTKADYVYDALRNGILEGRLAPGTRLRLAELASRYETSMLPVREALFMLRRDGLVVIESHKGATVTSVSLKELYDVVVTGTYLQMLAFTEAVPHHTERTISMLTALHEKMKRTNVGSKYSELNDEFDRLLRAPCGNEFLNKKLDEIAAHFFRRQSRSIFEMRPERRTGCNKTHEAMLDALKARSASKFKKAVETHRNEAIRVWREVVAEAEGSAEGHP
ncbi:DNA-binding GntR family transcriptional regulator [Bradyrhizobium sp. IAR9]|uniref:GntR family transcriptional regulator n=1 Tax=Bradyrhizobium sp. IAR9 TaxID=2663841 RepID=UPI0015CEF1EF|nr:GntR family transcriptional regulator [Bradyrhizobium sp. IAR9]NYG45358.1 DNA-binding GntR family transcriptional regulator [Bradyrhizobium sp. IAR9]